MTLALATVAPCACPLRPNLLLCPQKMLFTSRTKCPPQEGEERLSWPVYAPEFHRIFLPPNILEKTFLVNYFIWLHLEEQD